MDFLLYSLLESEMGTGKFGVACRGTHQECCILSNVVYMSVKLVIDR